MVAWSLSSRHKTAERPMIELNEAQKLLKGVMMEAACTRDGRLISKYSENFHMKRVVKAALMCSETRGFV